MKKLIELEPFAVGYLKAKGSQENRIAEGILCYAKNIPLVIDPAKGYAGNTARNGACSLPYSSSSGISFSLSAYKEQIKKHPFSALPLFVLHHAMFPHVTEFITFYHQTRKEHWMERYRNLWGRGGGHGNPDYKMLFESGTEGLKDRIAFYSAQNKGKEDFYHALSLTVEALETVARRYQEKAIAMVSATENEQEKANLQRIADALENVPYRAPRNFFEACQFFWLAFSFLEIDSPGLFDYALGEYYEKDETGTRFEDLCKLWELFHDTRTWNLCIGGSDGTGKDLCNELTFDVLKAARKYRYNTPNITMRFHKNSPERAWKEAVETIATGIGMPAIYNDECVCKAMEMLGIPPSDSHLYCMNGCNQIDIFGKSHMGLEDGEFNVAKALEYLLFGGRCGRSHKKLGLDLGDIGQYDTFEKLMEGFFKEIDYMAKKVTDISVRAQKIYAKHAPNPWRSNLFEGCFEKGLDYKDRGPTYGHGQILIEGLTDAVDSLTAIKHFIYDEKKYSLATLVRALKKDFKGFDGLYKDFSSYLKFGNDEDEPDEIYSRVTDYIYRKFLTFDTFRGGKFGVGCSTFNRSATYGRLTGALPNGKKRKDTVFSESIGAVPGCDRNGPTALLNSVLKADQTLATSGNVMQMKFSKAQFNTDEGKSAFESLAKTYFRLGGQTLQVNVVSKEELLDARIHPERHRNLVVRVGGFSAYFVELEKGLQENIIQRTEQF